MAMDTYHIQADWDPEASVWVATSEDVPGLATEAETIEALTEKLRVMIPEASWKRTRCSLTIWRFPSS